MIKCAEPTRLIALRDDDLDVLRNSSHRWAMWYGAFLEDVINRLNRYYNNLLEKDATKRYFALIEAYPEKLQRIPLGHVASYLGISQVSLSRIRAGTQKK